MRKSILLMITSAAFLFAACDSKEENFLPVNPNLELTTQELDNTVVTISRTAYHNKLQGFWLGQSIANWTGLITEMDKIGNVGKIKTGDFYTREDWAKPDQPSIWSEGIPSDLSPTIDFIFAAEDSIWGSDDDTDIEYIYQELLLENRVSLLSPEQIRDGWLKHIKSEEENFLWVSNQKAFDLMQEGYLPPATSDPANNEHYAMIDAQLTTEIFGFFAPSDVDKAIEMAYLPIRTTASAEAAEIAEFYVRIYNKFTQLDSNGAIKDKVHLAADAARIQMDDSLYPAKMYDFVRTLYESGISWERARDNVYARYQIEQADGYDITSQNLYCNGCFAAGINFAASLVSLFYGEGDYIETVKIAALCGWDSDNPAATWGGLLGFHLGKDGLEDSFNRKFSNQFNIHRTRQGFSNNGIDNFYNMALKGLWIIDRVVQEELGGNVDSNGDFWYIPKSFDYETTK